MHIGYNNVLQTLSKMNVLVNEVLRELIKPFSINQSLVHNMVNQYPIDFKANTTVSNDASMVA